MLEFLFKIDKFLDGKPFTLKIIGKSALLLAGLIDSTGTVDIDSLSVDGKEASPDALETATRLINEFGRAKVRINGYYLEFVSPAIVFLSQKPKWVALDQGYTNLSVEFLEPHHVAASKLFSAFSDPPRKRDKQDITAALDQKIVDFQKILNVADAVFDLHRMDARSDRFPSVHKYICQELVGTYGKAKLIFEPDGEE